MNPLTEARLSVAESCEVTGWTVHASPPEVWTAPSIVVSPGDPWSQPYTLGSDRVNFNVTLAANVKGTNEAGLSEAEDQVYGALKALRAAGVISGEVPSPSMDQARNMLTVTVPVSVQVTDE